MITQAMLHEIVERVTKDTGRQGVRKIFESVGFEWRDIDAMLHLNFDGMVGGHLPPPQLALDILMLGAAVGWMAAKGQMISGSTNADSAV